MDFASGCALVYDESSSTGSVKGGFLPFNTRIRLTGAHRFSSFAPGAPTFPISDPIENVRRRAFQGPHGQRQRLTFPPAWPAIIAAVTDLNGNITGVHRTWLALDGSDKAPVAYPRRAMGHLLGHGVRFGSSGCVMLAGEGIETMLSLRQVMPTAPAIAGLSAAHLAAILFPATLQRLYVARDDDPAGTGALAALTERANCAGIEIVSLEPRLDDFNSDLRAFGRERLAASLRAQLRAEDAESFLKAN